MAWTDNTDMSSALDQRLNDGLPLWRVYSYDAPEQYERKIRWFADALTRVPRPGALLDVGCGTGEILAWYTPPAEYLGVDVAPGLIAAAADRFPRYRFECLDVLRAELRSFDTVLMIGVLGMSPDPLRLIERAVALTRTNLLFDFLVESDEPPNPLVDLRYLPHGAVNDLLTRNRLEIVHEHRVRANIAIVAQRGSAL